MNIELTKQPQYLCRGHSYQKNIPISCPRNLSQYQIERCDRDMITPTLKYRGVTYQSTQEKCRGEFGDLAWIQTYRGKDYLNCLVKLSLHDCNS